MKQQFTISYDLLPVEALSATEQQLFDEAVGAIKKSYAPYSSFHVGCSLLLENGQLISGANQEVASYPVCICAEGVALSTASSLHPGIAIQAAFIVAANKHGLINDAIGPCGVCRQRLVEYEQRQQSKIAVYLKANDNSIIKINSAADLLPLSFNGSHLLL